MKKLINKIAKHILRLAIKLRLHQPLVWYYASKLVKVEPTNGVKTDPSKPAILAINELYFIKDLEIMANSGEFNVYKMPIKLQSALLRLYWTDDVWGMDHRRHNRAYYQPTEPKMIRMQERLRGAMRTFLGSLYRKMNIKCVLSANFTYKVDYDWSLVTHELGVPFVVFHKENLTLSPEFDRYWLESLEDLGKFKGTLIILHNAKMRDLVIKSGFATAEQIKVLGCLRMDDFIRRIQSRDPAKEQRHKRALLFSFQKNACLEMIVDEYFGDKGFVKFFEDVHVTFARVAKENPDWEFVIKPKYGRDWFTAIEKVLEKNGLPMKDLPNLRMTVDISAQELIFSSDVVCGFASTTVLESAVAGRPVIIPHFDEPAEERYADYIVLKEHYDKFLVARSPEEFKRMIEEKMRDPSVDRSYKENAEAIFDRFVSSFEASSVGKYIACLKEQIGAQG